MTTLLILYASCGAGHRRAAEAVRKACAEVLPGRPAADAEQPPRRLAGAVR